MKTLKSGEFDKVFSRGERLSDSLLWIKVASSDKGGPGRVAFAAAKRLGNAVVRNRSKRVLREAARICGLPLDGYDLILFSTAKTRSCSPEQVAVALRRLLKKAGA